MNENYDEQIDEQILDAFLEEMLSGQQPPDLTGRIKAAWLSEKSAPRPPAAKFENIGAASASHDAIPIAPPIQPPTTVGKVANPNIPVHAGVRPLARDSAASRNSRRDRGAGRSSLVPALLGISAAGLLILLGWRFLPNDGSTQADNSSLTSPTENTGLQPDAAFLASGSAANSANESPSTANNAKAEVLSLDDLPFGSGQGSLATVPQRSSNSNQVAALTGDAVVAKLNRQLSDLWHEAGVTPSPRLTPEQIATRLRSRLEAVPSPTDLPSPQVYNEANSQRSPKDAIAQIVDSPEAARRLAERFVSNWFGDSRLPLDAPSVAALRRGLALQIRQGVEWNRVAAELIGGQITAGSPAETFLMANAGGGNHRLLERIGSDFLNTNATCIRCHDAGLFEQGVLASGEANTAAEQIANQFSGQISSQEAYWSMLAMLQGIDTVSGDAGERSVVDAQRDLFAQESPIVFYEVLDGRMKAAAPDLQVLGAAGSVGLSVGQASDATPLSPRSQLARWVAGSRRFDEATVNQVWEMLLGRPLTPQVAAIEPIAVADRARILNDLATQFRANGRDVRLLVQWIANSDAFARATLPIDSQQWLVATNEELEQRKLAELVFAAGPTTKLSEPRSLSGAVLAITKWRQEPARVLDMATLAQPASNGTTKSTTSNRSKASGERQPPLDFVVHGLRPTVAQQTFVQQILAAKRLSWEQRVDHLVAIRGHAQASDRVQQLAKELLQRHSGDAQAALLDLLWAVDMSVEG